MRPTAVFGLFLLFTVSLGLSCRSGTTLAEEIALTKQAGLPTTPHELQAPLPPANQNAALVYSELTDLLKKRPLNGDEKKPVDGVSHKGLSSDHIARLRRTFSHRSDIGNLISRAVSRQECVFERPWEQGAEVLFSEYPDMRFAARWLAGESAILLHDGRTKQAIDTQALGFHIAHHFSTEPDIIARRVAIAIDAISLAGMERILYAAGDRPEIALAVHQAIEKEWQPRSMASGMYGDMVMDLVELEKLRKTGPDGLEKLVQGDNKDASSPPSAPVLEEKPKNWDRFLDDNGIVLLELWRPIIAAADKPYTEAVKVMREAEKDVQSHTERKDMRYLVAAIMVPVSSQAIEQRAIDQAKASTVLIGASLLIWKAKHGSFPEKLEDALQTIPSDPFDGMPLRYRREGKGFVIYSIGPTGHFDGGSPERKPEGKESLFRYPRPPYLQ